MHLFTADLYAAIIAEEFSRCPTCFMYVCMYVCESRFMLHTPNPIHGGVIISAQGAVFAMRPPHDAQIMQASATAMSFSAHRSEDATMAANEARTSLRGHCLPGQTEGAYPTETEIRIPSTCQTAAQSEAPFAGSSGASTPEQTRRTITLTPNQGNVIISVQGADSTLRRRTNSSAGHRYGYELQRSPK